MSGYIITTTLPDPDGRFNADVYHRAVATLDEARRWVTRGVSESGRMAGSPDYAAAANLPESGGTIGPLPDGAIIEVRPQP